MKSDDPDHNTLKYSLDLDFNLDSFGGTVLKEDLKNKSISYKIYRVKETKMIYKSLRLLFCQGYSYFMGLKDQIVKVY